jgi:hypothetical protein
VVGCDQATVKRTVDDFMQNGKIADSHKAAASHATDFEPPIYNVWKQQAKTSGAKHFGNSEKRQTCQNSESPTTPPPPLLTVIR